jgi:hypothetical protein
VISEKEKKIIPFHLSLFTSETFRGQAEASGALVYLFAPLFEDFMEAHRNIGFFARLISILSCSSCLNVCLNIEKPI